MFEKIKGQDRALTVLSKLLTKKNQSRTLLFLGPKGVGKMTTAIEISRFLLKQNPFLSPDVSIYRNDSYGLKTRYFLSRFQQGQDSDAVLVYFHSLLNRLSQAVFLGEFSNDILSKYKVQTFRTEFEERLLNGTLESWIKEKGILALLKNLSDILAEKRKIPIRQIRHLIEFHQYHSDAPYRMSILGEFDDSTEETQNSALKLFEEPAANTLIILTATSTENLLPTLLSRALTIKFQSLKPSVVTEIMGTKARGLLEEMQNEVYQYREKRKQNLIRFFNEIAPHVQYEFKLFEFIDELITQNELVRFFLKDLSEIFRDILIYRNALLRKVDLSTFLSFPEFDFTHKIAHRAVTAEIRKWVNRLEEELRGMRSVNLSAKTFLPALLIDLSRWYQSKIGRNRQVIQ